MEPQGGEVSAIGMFNKMSTFFSRTAAESGGGKQVWGKYRERTMNQNVESGVTACSKVEAGTQG